MAAIAVGQWENAVGRVKLALGRIPDAAARVDLDTFQVPDSKFARAGGSGVRGIAAHA